MKSITREVQIKCWGDSKEKDNSPLEKQKSHLQYGSNFFYNHPMQSEGF